MWAKIPVAATASIACAACVAAAVAVAPAANPGSDQLKKIISEQINLTAIDLDGVIGALNSLSSTDGIFPLAFGLLGDPSSFIPADDPETGYWPGYAALDGLGVLATHGPGVALGYYAATNGIPAYLDYLTTGNWDSLRDVAAFSALPVYEDLFSQNPDTRATAVDSLDSINGTTAYAKFLSTGDLEAFRQVDGGQVGLAALSATPDWQVALDPDSNTGERLAALGNIDAFSALPSYASIPAVGVVDGLGGIDAFSALPAYRDLFNALNAPEDSQAPEVEGLTAKMNPNALSVNDDSGAVADEQSVTGQDAAGQSTNPGIAGFKKLQADLKAAREKIAAPVEQPSTGGGEVAKQDENTPKVQSFSAPEANVAPPAAPAPEAGDQKQAPSFTSRVKKDAAPTDGKSNNGSYSGVFTPGKSEILFGTGGGGGADNGIRGWDKVANGIRGALGMPKEKSSDGGSDSNSGGGDSGGE